MNSKTIDRRKDTDSKVAEWMHYIYHFKEPKNDVKRMRYHYLCMKKYGELGNVVLHAFFAFFAFIPVLLIMCFKSIRCSGHNNYDAVMFCPNDRMRGLLENDLPAELESEFPERIFVLKNSGVIKRLFDGVLDASAFRSVFKVILRYPFAVYMNFYYLVHVAFVCKLIKIYSPRAIITIQTEFDFATSMLTEYSEQHGIEYIGCEHGDYVLSPERAFVRFSRFYAWDDDMIDVFCATRSPRKEFRVYNSKRKIPLFTKKVDPEYFMTYYLDDQGYDDIVNLKRILTLFVDKGRKVKLRIHPRIGDLESTREIFKDTSVLVEDPRNIPLRESIENSKYIVSTRSTVLSEAYMSGFDVVIDDMSEFTPIKVLEELKYNMLNKTDLRLSNLLADER